MVRTMIPRQRLLSVFKQTSVWSRHLQKLCLLLFFFSLLLWASITKGWSVTIEKSAGDFSGTNFFTPEQQAGIKKTGVLSGPGEADYSFAVPDTGWYELWVEGGGWQTDLYLDGKFLVHTPLTSNALEGPDAVSKQLNLYLLRGEHSLKFSFSWWPGFPSIRRFFLQSSQDISGKVSLVPEKDYLVFRRGETFPVDLTAGKEASENVLQIKIIEAVSEKIVQALEKRIPSGEGLYRETLAIPTDQEGIFDLTVTDSKGKPVNRTIQYLVVDTGKTPSPTAPLKKELLATIDCGKQNPDYYRGETRIVNSPLGSYLESDDKGKQDDLQNASYLAYKLNLPTIQEPYLLEIDYPDDDERGFTVSVVEKDLCPYSLDAGVLSGGAYPLSNRIETLQIFFYPRQKDPRLFFFNSRTHQRIAVSRIRIYKVTSDFPVLAPAPEGRQFGLYFEECFRSTAYFGAMPTGNCWATFLPPLERWAKLSNYVGANLWLQTIAVYQSMMWPSRLIPGYAISSEDMGTVIGQTTFKEPFKRDLVRLMLLICEKYRIDFIGELSISGEQYLDKRFGGQGTPEDDNPQKPWLSVSREGKTRPAEAVSSLSYYNPLYPGIQDWAVEIFQEITERYQDSPSFKGLAVRLLSWTFSSWKAFPSIDWGYEDYTIGLFEKETGIKIPVEPNDPERFSKRYNWLMVNSYQEWVNWRCRKIYQYYDRLAKILTKARPDLKLYINAFGPTYDVKVERGMLLNDPERDWLKTIKETGIDPALYRNDQRIVFSDSREYPAVVNIRGEDSYPVAVLHDWQDDSISIKEAGKPADDGTISGVRFFTEYMNEYTYPHSWLGMEESAAGGTWNMVHMGGVQNPSGRGILARYALALFDGNIVFLTDGGGGYILGQPEYLREFMAEYRSLPAIGMKRHQNSGDSVALWSGNKNGKYYFYLVNRADYPVNIRLSIAGGSALKYLSTGKSATPSGDGLFVLSLLPYQLSAFVLAEGSKVTEFKVEAPEKIRTELSEWLSYAEKIVSGEITSEKGETTGNISLDSLKKIGQKLTEARNLYEKGRYWEAKQILQSHFLVRLYQVYGLYPPNLFQRKKE